MEARPVGLDAQPPVDHEVKMAHPGDVDLGFDMEAQPSGSTGPCTQ